MLTSFFGKSNPVNYLILGIFIVAGHLFDAISGSSIMINSSSVWKHGVFIVLSVLSMLLLDFIIRKNVLTRQNTFGILFFCCFMVMLPAIILQPKILVANLFLLLAIRRIMSLPSDKNSEKKILDASIWITVASFFYFWGLLFFLPLWIAIVQKPNVNYKQLLIPIIGLFSIFVINVALHFVVFDSYLWLFVWKEPISLDFSAYNSASLLIPVAVIFSFLIWTGFYRIFKLSTVPAKEKSNYLLILFITITSVFVALAGPEKTGGELLFIFAPVAIVSANYIEAVDTQRPGVKDMGEFWFKEILLWLVVLLPVVLLFI